MSSHQKMKSNNKKVVVFAGGETAGPIMPLLAIAKTWQEQEPDLVPIFVDRKVSVAAHLVRQRGFEFCAITAGKLRRYWSWKNFISPLLILFGVAQSLYLLVRVKPILVMGAGGYVQVPVIFAAWLMRIPRIIHQQDVIPSFSNRLMAIFANRITTTFEKSTKDFPEGTGLEKKLDSKSKIFWTGNPCELDAKFLQTEAARQEARKLFKLDPDWPTVLVIGGGSGARGLNQLVAHSLPELLKSAQVIHATGVGRKVKPASDHPEIHDRYHQYEFIDRRDLAYAIANVVISRAGVGSLTDLSKLSKISIVVPMPNSHQEWNAHYLYQANAAIVVDQIDIGPEYLAKVVKKIFFDAKMQEGLQQNIHNLMPQDANEKMMKVIKEVI